MKAQATQFLEVTEAEYLSGYKLLLRFDDGTVRVVDFGPFLAKARNPDTTDFRDLDKFKSFHIQDGDLVWGDYQMIFPIMDLYRGNILKGEEATSTHFVLSAAAAPVRTVSEKKTKSVTVSYRKSKRKKVLPHG
ncbi:MAG: DUF2442 domain-containing protein [Chloroflexi bacterium]|nr:DUF2442 domain-containing protein [Chloroflexota bacterium]